MPNIIFDIQYPYTSLALPVYHLHTCIYKTRSKAHGNGFITQSVERWCSDPGPGFQFPARGLGVAFFTTGPRLGLNISGFRIYFTLKNLSVLETVL